MTPDEFMACMAPMLELYGKELSEGASEIYYRSVRELDAETFAAACSESIKRSRFFPSPSEILDLAGESTQTAGELAWLEVQGAISSLGYMRTPKFSDPAIHRCVRSMGGWHAVCFPSQDEQWQRKRFLELFDLLQGREVPELPPQEVAGYLAGDTPEEATRTLQVIKGGGGGFQDQRGRTVGPQAPQGRNDAEEAQRQLHALRRSGGPSR